VAARKPVVGRAQSSYRASPSDRAVATAATVCFSALTESLISSLAAAPQLASAEHGLDRSDRQVFERVVGVKDDYVAAAR
jgi:hypothetical protein